MKRQRTRKADMVLLAIALLSAFLNLFDIWKENYVNAYYTSAVRSMLQSFHNFFYASFDPAGYVTVDKPPVTFWVQTFSAYLFGLHGWSVILPQALAGVGSILLIYFLVKPSFGLAAARLGALAMAVTPVAAAVARTNNVDSLLVFTLLVAAWLLFKGVQKQKASWMIGAFAVIGVGFNMKMMQAYMVVPAFGLLYLLAYKVNWKKKLSIGAAAAAVLLLVSMSWAVVVDSVPKEERPYIGSSQTNSVLELAFGYNGIQRLTGRGGGKDGGGAMNENRSPGERPQSGTDGERQMGSQAERTAGGSQNGQMQERQDGGSSFGVQPGQDGGAQPGRQQPDGARGQMPDAPAGGTDGRMNGGPMGGGAGGGGGMFGTGNPGPLRLFQSGLSGQVSWLIPFAAFGCVGLLAGMRIRRGFRFTDQQKQTLFWLSWLIPGMIFFSVAGFFHQYYLIMLAPPVAALVGAGWTQLWGLYKLRSGWASWLLPAAVLVTTAVETIVLYENRQAISAVWMYGVGAVGAAVTLAQLVVRRKQPSWTYYTALGSLFILLIAPLYWSATPILYGQNSKLPQAGPQASGARGGMQPGAGDDQVNAKLIEYLTSHNTGETYLFATTNATTAAPYIIETGKAVMAMGGYSGSDPIMTVDKLKQLAASKQLKYVLLSGGGFGGPGGGGSSEALQWIKENSTVVPQSEWQSAAQDESSAGGRSFGRDGNMTLYELKS
ncbi:glycosyltransferase family 39 protein [Paenibacillus doosanensis]|uniref:glycosyltransferase family 39 protein n=1 Tax=Paenibacillus doosanensis TaxID=1229154 RepID=UPI00218055ED|nr:glycosyltransferase family 39 protein [Paenibacillus doosanensis]MCS7461586.1 glycosyltransferase family 39 protein [Paenibacillus doosanensis]